VDPFRVRYDEDELKSWGKGKENTKEEEEKKIKEIKKRRNKRKGRFVMYVCIRGGP
jgi:hypothetical protein